MSVSLGGSRVGLAFMPEASASHPYGSIEAVRKVVREAMIAGGLGRVDPSRPLSDIVQPGMTVLLKPNWVLHENRSGRTMDCMITHPTFLLAVLQEVIASGAGHVLIADAPIQGARFELIAPEALHQSVREIAGSVPVDLIDLRNVVATVVGRRLDTVGERRPADRFVLFTLGSESCLEAISVRDGIFRNTCYDSRDMARIQRRGEHRFLLCREPFEVDVILNLPKLKAHAKAGVTAALKNLVGLNGDKNFLPHHRVGGSSLGGDCYEGLRPLKRIAEFFLDMANRRIGRGSYVPWAMAAAAFKKMQSGDLEGKWHGNDTTWRMVLDLNRILVYGRPDGTLAATPQRRLYSLTDAIIAGEGNGPLAPEEVWLGAVTFAENSVFADLVHTALMRFDWRRMALVREAFASMQYPLVAAQPDELVVDCKGQSLALGDVSSRYGRTFRPPDRWKGHIELC
jgi:uncharacterized protein (DUF362 family)